MAYTKREHEINYDQVAAYLKDAVNKVKTQEDPDVLNNLKKVFKKNVPFSLRGYVTAYLLKYARIPYHFGNENRNDRNNKNDFRRERNDFRKTERPVENHERTPRPQLDPSMTTTIFVSIGRNRRVFPRDLVGLICSVVGLDRDRIGEIRVLANYSFVQLLSEDAEKAINTLNGYNYRGRPLSVSFSKVKGEAEEGVAESAEENENYEAVPNDVENVSAQVQDSFSKENANTVAEQAAFAAQQAAYTEPTPEEIAAARAPRSSSSDTAEAAPVEE